MMALDFRNLRPQKYDWGKSTAPSAPNLFTPIAVTADPAEYGCKGIAIQKVFGSLENYATYEALYPELRQLGARSAEVARKVHDENRGAYQQCLEDAGFNNVGAPPLVAERTKAIASKIGRALGTTYFPTNVSYSTACRTYRQELF